MCPIDLDAWWPKYHAIIEKFHYDIGQDQKAADNLSILLQNHSITSQILKDTVKNRKIIVCGAGPSLPDNLDLLIKYDVLREAILLPADGATTALLERDLTPSIVITDLDGDIPDIITAQEQGAIIVIHAHGDNIPALHKHVPAMLEGAIIGSTQAEPRPNVLNYGGFTDGDRCVFWAEALNAQLIALIGMDLGDMVGRYSKPNLQEDIPASAVKRQKLLVARDLLTWLSSWSQTPLLNLTGSENPIPGIPDRDITKTLRLTLI